MKRAILPEVIVHWNANAQLFVFDVIRLLNSWTTFLVSSSLRQPSTTACDTQWGIQNQKNPWSSKEHWISRPPPRTFIFNSHHHVVNEWGIQNLHYQWTGTMTSLMVWMMLCILLMRSRKKKPSRIMLAVVLMPSAADTAYTVCTTVRTTCAYCLLKNGTWSTSNCI